jgi:hypothetical protein
MARVAARWRIFALGCGIAALTACGGMTDTVTVTPAGGTAITSGSAARGQSTGNTPLGTSIATSPAVGVSPSGVGKLEVTLMGTFEAACDYRIAGTGLMPGSRIDYDGQLGKRQYGPVAQDGTYSMRQYSLAKDADHGTLSATARDGSKVTTQFRVACSPLGPGYG